MRDRRRALAVGALLIAAACGGNDANGADEAATTTSAPPTTAIPTSTTTTDGSTTTTVADACPGSAPVVGAVEVTERPADADGDGAVDLVRSERPDPSVDEWLLTIELAAGGAAEDVVPGDGVAAVTVLGGYDLDGDGAEEIWARVGAGASATIVGLFRLDGCDLERVTFESGEPVALPVGGSVGTSVGVGCDTEPDADVTTYLASLLPGAPEPTYELSAVDYRLDGGVLTQVAARLPGAPTPTPDPARYADLSCGDLTL